MALHALSYYYDRYKAGQSTSTLSSIDTDFADFATAAAPAPPSHAASSAAFTAATHPPAAPGFGSALFGNSPFGPGHPRPFTKWYRVWERVTIHDFIQELIILPILLLVVIINIAGSRMNRGKVRQWAETYLPLVEAEFARVGFGTAASTKDVRQTLQESSSSAASLPDTLVRQKKKNEFFSYATGRANVASLDLKLTLYKRYNPFVWAIESGLSFFVESLPTPVERMECIAHCFDGREKTLAPQATGSTGNSAFDGFVWAIVHKDLMKGMRDERYDLSLTATRDHARLPNWATVMSENAEVTEALLTPELVRAVEQAGENLEALIISDQPVDAPKKLNDLQPLKRLTLSLRLPSNPTATLPLFTHFLRLPDTLTSIAHFRPEVSRKLRATRDEEVRKIRRVDEEEKAEERKLAGDKAKKEERDRKLARLSAEEQRKFLEREKEGERRRNERKRTVR